MGNRSNKDNKVIGRGLDALLGDVSNSSSISEIDIDKIEPNPDQPRRHFDEESLQELAISIRSLGIVQPITVREVSCGHYLIISGSVAGELLSWHRGSLSQLILLKLVMRKSLRWL